MIRLKDVTRVYPRTGEALRHVSFHIPKGELAFLTGDSGAGKTTVLKLIHMQARPTSGEVRVSRFSSTTMRRRDVPKLRRRVGFVFQDFLLLERLTAAQNVAFALEVIGTSRAKIRPRVERLLAQVGLASKASALPGELSGGEQQRVAIARALASDPLVLLADEPTGNLDDRAAAGVFALFRQINGSGTTILMATHDAGLIRRHPDVRVLELEHGSLVFDSAAGGGSTLDAAVGGGDGGGSAPGPRPAAPAPGGSEVR